MESRDVLECRDAELAKWLAKELEGIELESQMRAIIQTVWRAAWLRGVEWGYDFGSDTAKKAIKAYFERGKDEKDQTRGH